MATTPKKSTQTKKPLKAKKITHRDISKRAHEIYLERIKADIEGSEESDWLQAEHELNSKPGK